jgi:hypothetical protein
VILVLLDSLEINVNSAQQVIKESIAINAH